MFAPTTDHSQMVEKPENRPTPFVPMVYENVNPTPMRWEYHVLTIDTREQELPVAAQLNELGNDGWILAGMLDSRSEVSRVYFYFVRQSEK